MRVMLLLGLLAVCGTLAAQEPAPSTEAAPGAASETAASNPAEETSPFRWRVGLGLGVSNGSLLTEPEHDGTMGYEGIVGEFSLRGTVAHRESGISATLRTCWGCHGIELEQATLNWEPAPLAIVRAGRLNVGAGSYNGLHDFNTRRTIAKPLNRIMGGMVRQVEFNHGVLPAPYVDNGVSAGLRFAAGPVGFAADAMVVSGLRGTGNDIDFIASRRYFDNNDEPSVGARLAMDMPLLSLNFAYLWGNYDPNSRRSYQFFSADAQLQLGPLSLEGEFAWRETEYTDPDSPGGENEFTKYGWWIMADWNMFGGLHLTGMVDTLYVKDIFLASFGPTPNPAFAVTDDNNRIVRLVGGVSYTTSVNVLLRLNVEYWEFSDFNDAWVIQAGIGWSF